MAHWRNIMRHQSQKNDFKIYFLFKSQALIMVRVFDFIFKEEWRFLMAVNVCFALLFEILFLKHLSILQPLFVSPCLTLGLYILSVACTLDTQMIRSSKAAFYIYLNLDSYMNAPYAVLRSQHCVSAGKSTDNRGFASHTRAKQTWDASNRIDLQFAINRSEPLPSVHPVDISSTLTPVTEYTFPFQNEVAWLLSMIAQMTTPCCGNIR